MQFQKILWMMESAPPLSPHGKLAESSDKSERG